MTRSLRGRLLAWTIGGMALVLALLAAVIYAAIERSLEAGFDEALASTAQALAASVKQEGSKFEIEFDGRDMPEFTRVERPAYFELWGPNAKSLTRSPSVAAETNPEAGLEPYAIKTPDGALADGIYRSESHVGLDFGNLGLPDFRRGRAVVLVFRPRLEDDDEHREPASADADAPAALPQTPPSASLLTLIVARGRYGLDADLASLRWLLAGATGGTLLLTLVVAAVVVRQGLRPLNALAGQIAAVREDNLAATIPADRLPAELVPVVDRLNDLLRRLDEAFRRERTLTADVAHELRTPLAGLRSTIEVALTRPRTPADYQQTLRESLDIVGGTQRMAGNLLALARLESGQTPLCPEAVPLADLVAAAWRPHAEATARRGITVAARLPADVAALADRDTLVLAVSNVLANAAEYVDGNGRIDISARADGASVELVVANTGCRLAPEDAARVFDRFWRGDAARTDTGLHCGLGLSLVERAMTALGSRVAVSVEGGVFTVRLTLPEA